MAMVVIRLYLTSNIERSLLLKFRNTYDYNHQYTAQ